MADRSWTVGSLPDCDIRIENAAVSGRHCRLTQRGESFLVEDLGSTNGTFVGGERLNGPRIIRRGDPVTLGRNTPLPWPPMVRSVTIGRLPDNDIVIPLDMISGRHARLDQEGDTANLIDLESKNGTAINDPLNKVTRAAIQPTDAVYFGTHRVAAWELLKALPRVTALQGTAPEASGSELERELAAVEGERDGPAGNWIRQRFGSPSSWAWGIALSGLCAVLILGGPWTSRRQMADDAATQTELQNVQPSLVSPPSAERVDTKQASAPSPRESAPAPSSNVVPPVPPAPEEIVIRRMENAVALIGIRFDDRLVVAPDTVWACRPNAVICSTAIVNLLEKQMAKDPGLSARSIVVCTPGKTLAILKHTPGRGPAEGFSLAELEGSLDAVCPTASNEPQPLAGELLAALTCTCQQTDKPESIARRFRLIKIDGIDRAVDKSPMLMRCSMDALAIDLQGSPVFDPTGSVVGCVRTSANGVDVVPIARLRELLSAIP